MSDTAHAVDLSTTYLGLRLRSPIVASASPITGDRTQWDHLERAGAGAVVLPSLFEEEIEHDARSFDAAVSAGTNSFAESLSYFPAVGQHQSVVARHLALVEQARQQLSIPVIASLNGATTGGWVHYASDLERAGAHAIELNLYDVAVDPECSAHEIEQRYVNLVAAVRAQVQIPLAIKIGPWFTSLGHFATALCAVGADGLVLFNRLYQPDIDVDTLLVTPRLQLSTSRDLQLPLHWIGILHGMVPCSLAGTSGVHDGVDALKLLLAGADVAMTTSAVLRLGPGRIGEIIDWLRQWMVEHDYTSVDQLKGSVSHTNTAQPAAYERANYYQVLHSWH
jgi:dihydroorotate dehydrogenase (fumarate)